ncbi:C4-dicarboxylate ABC transporter substrate-binding protein [Azoarcus sp. TTM-91]|uniref:TRAP transporter substrate-binding protein n=1 Tax=Azoarcus sp. TTM-91 TaxID=2691581 RepID=UPI00145CFE69|nr:TRAP transporter substrate-binding protein [Azoarcus sp. TTM-91]NMG35719.1 C4-dicarboxylate ABC transporter substrate-binding protein [Azoarcus sp. TTM-91]
MSAVQGKAPRRLRSRLACSLGALALVLGASAVHAADFTMKLATATVNDVQTEAIKRFAKRVETRSNGRIKTELYPAAQLGSNTRMIEGLQLGTIEFYTGPAAYLVGVDARYQIMDMPGVFTDARHAQRTFSDPEFRKAFLDIGTSKGLVGLGTYIYGNTAFATRFEGAKVADFKGRKLRVLASRVERKGVELMGATAVPVDFSEVVTALQQGTIDGLKSSPPAFTSLKLINIVKNVTATEDGVMGELMLASKQWWDTLPADLQKMLREEAAALEPELYDFVLDDQAKAYKLWEEQGGKVFQLPAQERAALLKDMREAASAMLRENKATGEMLDLTLRVAERVK